MVSVGSILESLEDFCPARWAFPFDKVGLQVGRKSAPIQKAVVSLDWSQGLLAFANDIGAKLIVCHHPLLWDPLTELTERTRASQFALSLAENQLNFIACHTNWDSAPGGVNDALAERLNLQHIQVFGSAAEVPMSKICTFTPESSVQQLIDSLSNAGAGKIGNYDRCAFLTPGCGTFLGNSNSNPAVGVQGKVEVTPEAKIEMIIRDDCIAKATAALRSAHPYEEPAIDITPLAPNLEMPIGRLGFLPGEMKLHEFSSLVESQLGTQCLAWGTGDRKIRNVAVLGGAASSEWRNALEAGADVLVTGEVKQDHAMDAFSSGLCVVSAGHYATEQPGMESLCQKLDEKVQGVDWHLYTPEPGNDGRPL